MGTCMLAIIPGPVFALVGCVLELCFPMPLINVMLPNAIYRILDKTRTVYVIWKYIVAKCRNFFGEICPYSFRQRCRLNASATKYQGNSRRMKPLSSIILTWRVHSTECRTLHRMRICRYLLSGWSFMEHDDAHHCARGFYTLSVNVYIEQDRHMWRYQNMWTLWHCSQEATRHMSRFSCVSDIFTLCCYMNISVKDRNKRLTEKTITPSCGPLSFFTIYENVVIPCAFIFVYQLV